MRSVIVQQGFAVAGLLIEGGREKEAERLLGLVRDLCSEWGLESDAAEAERIRAELAGAVSAPGEGEADAGSVAADSEKDSATSGRSARR